MRKYLKFLYLSSALLFSSCFNADVKWGTITPTPTTTPIVGSLSFNAAFTSSQSVALGGSLPSLQVLVSDSSGNPVTNSVPVQISVFLDSLCKVPFWNSSGTQALGLAATSSNNGTANFGSIAIAGNSVPGVYYLQASSSGYTSSCSAQLSTVASSATAFAFTNLGVPTSVTTVGTPTYTFQLKAVDTSGFGNVDTQFASSSSVSANLALNSGCSGVSISPSNVTFSASHHGVITFNATFSGSGSGCTLTATSGSMSGTLPGTFGVYNPSCASWTYPTIGGGAWGNLGSWNFGSGPTPLSGTASINTYSGYSTTITLDAGSVDSTDCMYLSNSSTTLSVASSTSSTVTVGGSQFYFSAGAFAFGNASSQLTLNFSPYSGFPQAFNVLSPLDFGTNSTLVSSNTQGLVINNVGSSAFGGVSLSSGAVLYIENSTTIYGSLVIPQNSTVIVEQGGTLNVLGNITINTGTTPGLLVVLGGGTVNVGDGKKIDVYGKFYLQGSLTSLAAVGVTGSVSSGQQIKVESSGYFSAYGFKISNPSNGTGIDLSQATGNGGMPGGHSYLLSTGGVQNIPGGSTVIALGAGDPGNRMNSLYFVDPGAAFTSIDAHNLNTGMALTSSCVLASAGGLCETPQLSVLQSTIQTGSTSYLSVSN